MYHRERTLTFCSSPAQILRLSTMGSITGIDAVWAWNEHPPTFINETVHSLVHKQAKLRPNALAVDAHDGKWTYADLDAAADRVAHYLVNLGTRPEDIVPLCFEKSGWA